MKKLLILLLCLFVGNSFASGIASNSASAPCTNNTLETYSGNSNLAADWQPNEIQLRWYNENERLTVQSSAQSCVYDGTLTIPSTQPTRTGYTFAGWEVRLPGAYTELEYLEGNGTQYINTGVILTSDNVTYQWTGKDNYMTASSTLFGTEEEINGNRIIAGTLYGNNSSRNGYVGTTAGRDVGYVSSDGNFHNWSWVIKPDHTAYLIKDSALLSQIEWSGTLPKSTTVLLYANRVALRGQVYIGQYASVALKYFKITDNGNLVFNGVPAKRNSDNVAGMYDTVTKTFFTNAGTGSFIAGPVVQ